jgi:hypothetical protein
MVKKKHKCIESRNYGQYSTEICLGLAITGETRSTKAYHCSEEGYANHVFRSIHASRGLKNAVKE